jgi:regulatory protein
MAKITAIKVQRRNKERVNIYLDGEFAFGLTRIVAGWLQIGQVLDEKKIEALKAEDEREQAYLRALNYLSYRPRSIKEVEQNLRKHKVPEVLIPETIERLKKNDFVNDMDFAKLWIENRNRFRPRGKRALRLELRQKGIDNENLQEVLDDLVDEESLAYQAGLKKARQLAKYDWQDFRRKLGAFLARRGFPYSVISPLMRPLWKTVHPEEDTGDDFY